MKTFYKIEGQIFCSTKGNANEEITLTLNNLSNGVCNSFKMGIDGKVEKKKYSGMNSIRIKYFAPNLNNFVLCNYQLLNSEDIPLRGLYQKKRISDDQIRLLIKIIFAERMMKYVSNVKIMSFLGDGITIRNSDLIVDDGVVDFNSEKTAIILSISSKLHLLYLL